MSSVQVQISYRDLHLLRRFSQIIKVRNKIMDNRARNEICSDLERALQLTGEINIDSARESMLIHANQPELLQADLQSNQESVFPEDDQFAIEVTPSQAEIIAEISILKEIEAIIGRVQFEKFIVQQYSCRVIDPRSQFSVTSGGGYEFRPVVIPAEIMRGNMAAYLLGDREASASASSLIIAVANLAKKTWAEIINDPDSLNSPLISSDFSELDIFKVFQIEDRFHAIALRVGRRISLLQKYRGQGGDIKISDSNQISLAPNEDGALKISRSPYPLSDRVFTPDEIAQWHYANQLLGHSPEEKAEVIMCMADALKSYNQDLSGQSREPITNFRDLYEYDRSRAYVIPGLSQEQVDRFLTSQAMLVTLTYAFDKDSISDLYHRQQSQNPEDRSIRIFNLGQVYPCENKLEITPIAEFRLLSLDEQKARTLMITQRAEAKKEMLVNNN